MVGNVPTNITTVEPPNYDEIDPPPSYSALFPNQKINSAEDSTNETIVIDVEHIETIASSGEHTIAPLSIATATTTNATTLTSTANTNNY